jgi:RimJ/RimL family protein N-acetyltransferase
VRVEPLDERHRDGLREAAEAAPQIFRFTGLGFMGFENWFEQALAVENEVPFAVVVDGREVGSTRYLAIVPEHRRAEIGWTWLDRRVWGTGANVETKLLLLERAFERCGLQRVEFKTDARNLRSRGALLALGARFEGIFRKHMVLPDGPRDSAWYAITEDDWPAVKGRLERRLEAPRTGEPR